MNMHFNIHFYSATNLSLNKTLFSINKCKGRIHIGIVLKTHHRVYQPYKIVCPLYVFTLGRENTTQ